MTKARMRACKRCGKVIIGRGRKRCPPCAEIVVKEQRRVWRKLHPHYRSEANHLYYVKNRQNNPVWIAKNKILAKLWRARQA